MPLPEAERKVLLTVAGSSISYSLNHTPGKHYEDTINLQEYSDLLIPKRATFVTLEIDNNLRGCIGTLEAIRPLVMDVAHNAREAAFHDPRFAPLSQNEFEQLNIHLSILGQPEPMQFENEGDLLNQLRPGIDGLILNEGMRRATFLPTVWETLADPISFLQHLKQKAGLPPNYWSSSIKILRYTTESF